MFRGDIASLTAFTVLIYGALFAMLVLEPLKLATAGGYPAVKAGAVLLPATGALVVASPMSPGFNGTSQRAGFWRLRRGLRRKVPADDDPDRLATAQRMTASYPRSALYGGDSSWSSLRELGGRDGRPSDSEDQVANKVGHYMNES